MIFARCTSMMRHVHAETLHVGRLRCIFLADQVWWMRNDAKENSLHMHQGMCSFASTALCMCCTCGVPPIWSNRYLSL